MDDIVASLRAALAASEAKAQAEAAKAQAEARSARSQFLAERKKNLIAELSLVEARANFPRDSASEVGSASSPVADRWTFGPKVYHELVARSGDSITAFLEAAVNRHAREESRTAAPPGLPERSSVDIGTKVACDSVHRHANGIVESVMAALGDLASAQIPAESRAKATAGASTALLQPSVSEMLKCIAVVREQHYDGRCDLQAPDEAIVLLRRLSPLPARLTANSQLVVLEYKIAELLDTSAPCVGERQGAGYASQHLMAVLLELEDIELLKTVPLFAWALYTDSCTSSIIKVTVNFEGVLIEACRMPFLSTSTLPEGTAGKDGGFAALALALSVIDSLRADELRSENTAIKVDLSLSGGDGRPAVQLGQGSFARALLLPPHTVVKCPVSLRMLQSRWAARVGTEHAALTLLSRRGGSRHVPSLEDSAGAIPVPEAVRVVFDTAVDPFVRLLRLGDRPFPPPCMASVSMGARRDDCACLILRPLCSSLVGACDDISSSRRLNTVPLVQAAALAFLLPVMSALSFARRCYIAHVDVAIRNVMLADVSVPITRDSAATLSSAESGAGSDSTPSSGLSWRWNLDRFFHDISAASDTLADPLGPAFDSAAVATDLEPALFARTVSASTHIVGAAPVTSAGSARSGSTSDSHNLVVLMDWGQARPLSSTGALTGTGSGRLLAAGVDAYQCLHLARDVLRLLLPRLRMRFMRSSVGDPAAASTAKAVPEDRGRVVLHQWYSGVLLRYFELDALWNRWRPNSAAATEAAGPSWSSARALSADDTRPLAWANVAAPSPGSALSVVLQLLGLTALAQTANGATFITQAGVAGGCTTTDVASMLFAISRLE